LGLFAACILIFGMAFKDALVDKSKEESIKES
jgi:hypothetical protein